MVRRKRPDVAEAEEVWARFVAHLRDGLPIAGPEGALAAIGRSNGAYQKRRQRDARFAAECDLAKRLGDSHKKYDGSFVSFRRHYLGMETTWFQQVAADRIENARPGEVTLILWPPAHGKTTLLEDWCTYKLVEDPSFRITACSANVDHPKKILSRVKARLDPEGPFPAIARDFGPLVPENKSNRVWGQLQFTVAGASATDERDFSMRAIGVTGNVQGTRADLMLIDDVQSLHNLEQADKYYEIIRQDFLSRPGAKGRTVIIGTRVGEFDVYRKLIDSGLIYARNVVKFPAYDVAESPKWPPPPRLAEDEKDAEALPPEGMKFLWPEAYSDFDYARLRFTVGESAWARNYMQYPEAATAMTFPEKVTDLMKDDLRSVIHDPKPRHATDTKVPCVVALDPAIQSGNGVLSAAMHHDRMEVLNGRLDFGLTSTREILSIVDEEIWRLTTPTSFVSEVVVEDKAFQRGLMRDDLMLDMQRRHGFRLVPNTTGREKSDPDIGVPAIEYSIMREEVTIPWADDVSEKAMDPLLRHLHQWRPGVAGNKLEQDMVMALWFAWRRWRRMRDTPVHRKVDPAQFRRPASPLRLVAG